MIVGKGAMTFRTFTLDGPEPVPSMDAIFEALEHYAFDGFVGEAGEARGWVSIEHLLDVEFAREKNIRGPFVVFGLRQDKRKVAPALLRAHVALEIKAALEANGGARLPMAERREIKRRVHEELIETQTPVSKVVGIVWNVKRRRVHVMTTSRAMLSEIEDLFDRSFELTLESRGPAVLGFDAAAKVKQEEAFNDLMPTMFFAESAGVDNAAAAAVADEDEDEDE